MISKEDLDNIAINYHKNEDVKDKFIEDICQFYTYEWVFDKIKNCSKVLELGYGEGNFTQELVNFGFNVTLLDGSDILINSAKEKFGSKIETACDLFENFKTEVKFDAIIATHVLEHVDEPLVLLKRMDEWLNENGIIIIIVPNRDSLHRQLAVLMNLQKDLDSLSPRDLLVGHQRVYSFQTLISDIESANLSVVERKGFFLKVLPNSMMIDFSPELILALNKVSEVLPDYLLANICLCVKKFIN
jgi:2-polyprenyl-3-methyl-5-hydroxy-6-metoxy-1,4-benzoquinol methylase